MESNRKRTGRSARRGRARRAGSTLAAAGALSLLSGCLLFNEFKADGFLIKDDCFSLYAATFCVDFDSGRLDGTGLHAGVSDSPHCKRLKKIKVSGWVDKNDNGTEDEGEAIESTEHEVAEEEGSNELAMGDVSLALNAGSEDVGDVHLCVEVTRVGSDTAQTYKKTISKC